MAELVSGDLVWVVNGCRQPVLLGTVLREEGSPNLLLVGSDDGTVRFDTHLMDWRMVAVAEEWQE